MASGEDPCPEHHERTRRSSYRYCFYVVHHGRGVSDDSQWAEDLGRDEEFAIFDESDWHDLSDPKGHLYGVRRSPDGMILDLGTKREQIAKFWKPPDNNQPTHGFPLWPVACGRGFVGEPKEAIRPDRCPEKNGRGRAFTPFAVQPIEEGQVRMNSPRLIPDSAAFSGERIHFDGFEISWAGEDPLIGDLYFGSDDGRFRPKDKEGPPKPVCPSGEAVNGVAFSGQAMAVSTRCDVALIIREHDGSTHRAIYDGGAHDVIATSSGGFVAPLGVHGILTMKPTPGPKQLLVKWKSAGDRINFYKIANCSGDDEVDLIVGACRGDGIAIIEFDTLTDRINLGPSQLFQLPRLDVVDVCSLRSPRWPRAFAWLDSDLTIYLSRDVLEGATTKSLRIGNIPGKGYSLLHDRGHFFLLTSGGFYMLPDLASRFLAGDLDGGPTQILAHHGRSIDEIFLASDSLLFSIDGDIHRTPLASIMTEADRSGWSSRLEGISVFSQISWEKTVGLNWSSAA